MNLWELVSLELDMYGKDIGEYFEERRKIRRVKYQERPENAYRKTGVCKIVNKALGKSLERKLVVYGSGHYHHFTYGLCKHADRISKDYAYIHFDHHNDFYCNNKSDSLGCGSFVETILGNTNATIALLIGSYAPYNDKQLMDITENQLKKRKSSIKLLEKKLAKLPKEVYLSFDLDVMDPSVIQTAFSQGELKPKRLMEYIFLIKRTKHIIGADVLGYAGTDEDPGKELYAKIVDKILSNQS